MLRYHHKSVFAVKLYKNKIVGVFFGVLILFGGIIFGVILILQPQLIGQKAQLLGYTKLRVNCETGGCYNSTGVRYKNPQTGKWSNCLSYICQPNTTKLCGRVDGNISHVYHCDPISDVSDLCSNVGQYRGTDYNPNDPYCFVEDDIYFRNGVAYENLSNYYNKYQNIICRTDKECQYGSGTYIPYLHCGNNQRCFEYLPEKVCGSKTTEYTCKSTSLNMTNHTILCDWSTSAQKCVEANPIPFKQ